MQKTSVESPNDVTMLTSKKRSSLSSTRDKKFHSYVKFLAYCLFEGFVKYIFTFNVTFLKILIDFYSLLHLFKTETHDESPLAFFLYFYKLLNYD